MDYLEYEPWSADEVGQVMERLFRLERQLEKLLADRALQPCPELINISAARNMLGQVSRATIYRLLETGELESVKLGGRRLITRASIRAMLARNGL